MLNIAVNLYGQQILVGMVDEPEAAKHDLQLINEILCRLHDWYRANVPVTCRQCILPHERCAPPDYGQLCGCTTHLISARMYRQFIAPLDDQLLSLYPNGGMIHLCGEHTQHIPAWREMKSLRAIQLNDRAAWDLERYYRELRPDQVFYLYPCEGMPVERILKITGGERVVIQGPAQ